MRHCARANIPVALGKNRRRETINGLCGKAGTSGQHCQEPQRIDDAGVLQSGAADMVRFYLKIAKEEAFCMRCLVQKAFCYLEDLDILYKCRVPKSAFHSFRAEQSD